MLQLVVAGRYVATDTAWGDLEWGLCWPGYSDELTFDVATIPAYFRPGAIASLMWSGEPLWAGTLDEPVRGQKMRAAGLHRLGEDYAALDGFGNISRAANEALTVAIGRGLPWTKPDLWPDTNAPIGTDTPPTITQVLDAHVALMDGHGWGVFPDGTVRHRARSTPRLHVRPGGDGIGIAWDNYASTLIARYMDSGTSLYTTATRTDTVAAARWGTREATVTKALNDGAPMTAANAQSLLATMLANGRSRPGWTTPIEVEYGAVVTNLGQPVDLATIKPYETIRVHGLDTDIGDLGGRSYVDMNIERIRHTGPTTVLTPVGLVSPMQDVLSGKK